MLRLDILGVQAFVTIAEIGSFNAAASHLCLSATALSRRLKKLEESLGVKLLARTTRTVALTAEGTDFFPKARRVLQDLATSLEDLRAGGGKSSGNVRIGCLPTLASVFLPPLLRDYANRHPQNRVQVLDRSATEIREAMIRGELDLAITVAGAARPDLEVEKMFRERMVAVCPSSHPLAGRKIIRWQDLGGEPLISIGVLSATRMLIDSFVLKSSLQFNWAYQVEHLATAVSLVSANTGIAILPAVAVQAQSQGALKVVQLRQPLEREIALLRRKLPLSPAASSMYLLAKKALKNGGRTAIS